MSTAGASAPAPSSAEVLEFICLFTHDLRRKQKRWEDGRLKFHSFNNRVMVYDDRGSYVGDMHWRRDYEFGEGEEIELERGGIIVQVQDLVRSTEQDLSELIDKRAKEKEQRQLQAVARARGPTSVLPQSIPQAMPRPTPPDHFQLRHRPLHQLIGTPSGHHGKASVPQESPYDSRKQNEEPACDRASKRRKYEDDRPTKKGHAQALFGQTLTLSAVPMSSLQPRQRSKPEPSSSISFDDEQLETGQNLETALREQPKSSLCFNQMRRDSRATLSGTKNIGCRSSTDRSHSLSVDPRLKSAIIPANAEVIDLEDTNQPSSSGLFTAMSEHKAKKAVRKHVEAEETSCSELPKNQTASVKHQKSTKSRTMEARKHGKASSAITRIAESEAPSRSKSETLELSEAAKKSNTPMIELRLVSKKKRGLLMMSDRPNRPARTQSPEITFAARANPGQVDEAVVIDSPNLTSLQQRKISSKRDHSMILDEFLDLREEDDPFHSPCPEPEKQKRAVDGQLDLRNNVKVDKDTNVDSEGHSFTREQSILGQTKVSEQRSHGDDEEQFVPSEKSSKSASDSNLPTNTQVANEVTGLVKAQVATRTRRKRNRDNKIVLDEDEDPEAIFQVTDTTERSDRDKHTSDSNSDDVPSKQRKSLTKTTRRQRRGSFVPDDESEIEDDDELPRKRRTRTRKTRRGNVVSDSEPSEESEQDRPARYHKKKATQPLEERPRLTRVKKSIKSREVIGFDLSALKVPLGPRGIGVPFSILSTPTDEPVPERAVTNTVSKPSLQNSDEQNMQVNAPEMSDTPMCLTETAKMIDPAIGPRKFEEVQINQEFSNEKLTTKENRVAKQQSPEHIKGCPQLPTHPKPSPDQEDSRDDHNSKSAMLDRGGDHAKGKVDAHQVQDAQNVTVAFKECPQDLLFPPAHGSIDASPQGEARDVAQKLSSITQGASSTVRNQPKQEPATLSPQCEPAITEHETAESDTSATVKTTARGPNTRVSLRNSKSLESATIGLDASFLSSDDQPDVDTATPAAAGLPQPRRTVGLRRTVSAIRSINNVQKGAPSAKAAEDTSISDDSIRGSKPIARIANPASRGRKAALKSHAAGQAPQRVLPPTQPALLVPISTADLSMSPLEEPKKEPERPKKKMTFPGFQSARGEGPWSREAFDLLESGRPE